MTNKLINILKNILIGSVIGIANIIPGVSGGTMAVVLGIYKKLIHSISNFFTDKVNRKKYFFFLIQIGGGAIISIKLFAQVMEFLLKNHPQPTFLFFIGLIIGSVPAIYKSSSKMSISINKCLFFLVSFLFVIFLSQLQSGSFQAASTSNLSLIQYFILFISGFLAAGAMVVPGISGSFILLLLGSYEPIIQAISSLNFIVLLTVSAGALPGILIITKGIDICFSKYPGQSTYAILGLILGSIFSLWPGITFNIIGIISGFAFIIGLLLAKKLN
jgi:putative membrane protein